MGLCREECQSADVGVRGIKKNNPGYGWGSRKRTAVGLGQLVGLSQPWGSAPNAYRCSIDWINLFQI